MNKENLAADIKSAYDFHISNIPTNTRHIYDDLTPVQDTLDCRLNHFKLTIVYIFRHKKSCLFPLTRLILNIFWCSLTISEGKKYDFQERERYISHPNLLNILS